MNQPKHIAVVDDHTMFRKGLCLLIDLFPQYSVVLDAAGGRDLIRQLDPARLPDILLLDIVMPDMNGYTVANWVCERYPTVRILALSTMDSELDIVRMIRAGARGYLHKDAESTELKQAFEDVLSYGFYYNEDVARKIFRSAYVPVRDHITLLSSLTEEELVFLRLTYSEMTDYEIAGEMSVTVGKLDNYRGSLFRKLQLSTRVGLALFAIRHGIVDI